MMDSTHGNDADVSTLTLELGGVRRSGTEGGSDAAALRAAIIEYVEALDAHDALPLADVVAQRGRLTQARRDAALTALRALAAGG